MKYQPTDNNWVSIGSDELREALLPQYCWWAPRGLVGLLLMMGFESPGRPSFDGLKRPDRPSIVDWLREGW